MQKPEEVKSNFPEAGLPVVANTERPAMIPIQPATPEPARAERKKVSAITKIRNEFTGKPLSDREWQMLEATYAMPGEVVKKVKEAVHTASKERINQSSNKNHTLLTFFLSEVAPKLESIDEVIEILLEFKKQGANFHTIAENGRAPITYLSHIIEIFDICKSERLHALEKVCKFFIKLDARSLELLRQESLLRDPKKEGSAKDNRKHIYPRANISAVHRQAPENYLNYIWDGRTLLTELLQVEFNKFKEKDWEAVVTRLLELGVDVNLGSPLPIEIILENRRHSIHVESESTKQNRTYERCGRLDYLIKSGANPFLRGKAQAAYPYQTIIEMWEIENEKRTEKISAAPHASHFKVHDAVSKVEQKEDLSAGIKRRLKRLVTGSYRIYLTNKETIQFFSDPRNTKLINFLKKQLGSKFITLLIEDNKSQDYEHNKKAVLPLLYLIELLDDENRHEYCKLPVFDHLRSWEIFQTVAYGCKIKTFEKLKELFPQLNILYFLAIKEFVQLVRTYESHIHSPEAKVELLPYNLILKLNVPTSAIAIWCDSLERIESCISKKAHLRNSMYKAILEASNTNFGHEECKNAIVLIADIVSNLAVVSENKKDKELYINRLLEIISTLDPLTMITELEKLKLTIEKEYPTASNTFNNFDRCIGFEVDMRESLKKYATQQLLNAVIGDKTLLTNFISNYDKRLGPKIVPILNIFKECGADFNLKNGLGLSPLNIAVSKQNWLVVSELLRHGADETELFEGNKTLLSEVGAVLKANPLVIGNDSFIKIFGQMFSHKHCPKTMLKRIDVLTQLFKTYDQSLMDDLIESLIEHINGQPDETDKYKDLSLLTRVLIKVRDMAGLKKVLRVATKLCQNPDLLQLMEKEWGISINVLKPLLLIDNFFNCAVLAVTQLPNYKIIYDHYQAQVMTIFLKSKSHAISEQLNEEQSLFFDLCYKLQIKYSDLDNGSEVTDILFQNLAAAAGEFELYQINQCLQGLLACRKIKDTPNFSMKKTLLEIFSLKTQDNQIDTRQWLEQFKKLDELVFHKSVAGLPIELIAELFEKPRFNISKCLEGGVGVLSTKYIQVQNFIDQVLRKNNRPFPELIKAYQNDDCALFSIIEQAMRNEMHKKPHHTQMMTFIGLILSSAAPMGSSLKNILAQVGTGQGKSIIVAMVAAYCGIKGYGVDIITSTSNLAQRDHNEFVPFFKALGITSRALGDSAKAVNYTTIKGAVANIANKDHELLDGKVVAEVENADEPKVVIIDEVDTLIVDSGASTYDRICHHFDDFKWIFEEIWQNLSNHPNTQLNGISDNIYHKPRFLSLSESLRQYVRKNIENWYNSALFAKKEEPGTKYWKKDGKVGVVDKATGQIDTNVIMPHGLHQFLELKFYGVVNTNDPLVGTIIAYEDFFKGYKIILGLTGTLGAPEERTYVQDTYNMTTFDVPHFSKNEGAKLIPEVIGKNDADWCNKLYVTSREIVKNNGITGRPVLIIVDSIKLARYVYDYLRTKNDIPHIQLLTGDEPFVESERIVLNAGQTKDNHGMITVSTNIGGRGMDFKVTDERVNQQGGMHVIIGYFPDNERVELQAKGRTARQDKKGSYQFILNKEECEKYLLNVRMATSQHTTLALTQNFERNPINALKEARSAALQLKLLSSMRRREPNRELHQLCRKYFKDLRTSIGALDRGKVQELKVQWCLFIENLRNSPLVNETFDRSHLNASHDLPLIPPGVNNRKEIFQFLYDNFKAMHLENRAMLRVYPAPTSINNLLILMQKANISLSTHRNKDLVQILFTDHKLAQKFTDELLKIGISNLNMKDEPRKPNVVIGQDGKADQYIILLTGDEYNTIMDDREAYAKLVSSQAKQPSFRP